MLDRLKKLWNNTNDVVKWVIPIVVIALIVMILIYTLKPDEYEQLYTGLENYDSAEIQQILSEKSVEYRTEDNGSTIYIKGDTSLIRRELSSLDLPRNPEVTGLDKFSEISIGSTKFDKEVQYQSRLQQEISQNITQSFDMIEKAKVTLPKIKETSIFDDEVTDVRISVAVKTKQDRELEPENVKALQLFVASSIQEVKPENVEIVDSKMRVLSNQSDNGLNGKGASNAFKITNEAKLELQNTLEKTLESVYGSVNVIVNMDINFDEIVQNIETYDPEGTLISTEVAEERERNIQGEVGRQPGTDTNGDVPGYEIEDLDAEDATYMRDKEHLIENFSIGKTVEKVIKNPELRNTNVAVWIDSELTNNQIAEIEEMIAVSSGLTGVAEREEGNRAIYENGSVKVVSAEFVDSEEVIFDEEEIGQGEKDDKPNLWLWLIIGAALLIGLIVILVFVLRTRKERNEDDNLTEELEELVEEEPIVEEPKEEFEEKQEMEEEKSSEIFNFEWTEQQKDLRTLTNEVTSKFPKETADVIRRILKDKK